MVTMRLHLIMKGVVLATSQSLHEGRARGSQFLVQNLPVIMKSSSLLRAPHVAQNFTGSAVTLPDGAINIASHSNLLHKDIIYQ